MPCPPSPLAYSSSSLVLLFPLLLLLLPLRLPRSALAPCSHRHPSIDCRRLDRLVRRTLPAVESLPYCSLQHPRPPLSFLCPPLPLLPPPLLLPPLPPSVLFLATFHCVLPSRFVARRSQCHR